MTAPRDPSWLLEEAWTQVGRARTPEDRSRALATFRRAISTAAKGGSPSPELVARIAQLEAAAETLYAEVADAHVRKAIRALGSLRMAVEARLAAGAGSERVHVQPVDYEGAPLGAGWDADADEVLRFYGIPREHGDGRIVVQLHVNAGPDVRAYRGRKIVWRKPSVPDRKPRPRRAFADEAGSPNGHGRDA